MSRTLSKVAVGGKTLTLTIEGRERYPVRIRYLRELRNDLETLGGILIPTPLGQHIPLRELADIAFERRAQVIKSEDTFLTSYVVFDKKTGQAEVEVVEAAQAYLQDKIARGEWQIPAGVSYAFAGSYENQLRAKKRLSIVIPLTLFVIFLILYLQFRSALTTLFIFSGIFVAWAGGFLMLWLYAQDWFLNFAVGETNFRDLFQVRPFNLSVAVWVGFIALFGIATDNGVLIATYLKQRFDKHAPGTREEIRAAVLEAAQRRIRPALMTTATTLLALLPRAHLAGPWGRYHGADGHPVLWGYGHRAADRICRAGLILRGSGVQGSPTGCGMKNQESAGMDATSMSPAADGVVHSRRIARGAQAG